MNKWKRQAFMRLIAALVCAIGGLVFPHMAKVFWVLIGLNVFLFVGNLAMYFYEQKQAKQN